MAEKSHFDSSDYKGIFFKTEKYRKTCEGCGKGYHGHRWDAHHILPGVSFGDIDDEFARDCLKLTNYDINAAYSLGGLPKLTAFILFFQDDDSMPFIAALEKTVTMLRWGTVKEYLSDFGKELAFPGNYPVHNPTNWGHTEYNNEVVDWLQENVFDPLKKKKKNGHPVPQEVEKQLHATKDHFWGELVAIANGPGGGGHMGIEANMRNRYGSAKNGWWKPMCMTRTISSAPASPGLRC